MKQSKSSSKISIGVDVIIPVYNSINTLKQAIESILNQTVEVARILVIDDGSDVETLEYLKTEITKLPKVEVFYNDHSGLPGKMRRIGVVNSDAPWIAFLDSDDWWEPTKIEKQLFLAQKYCADLVCSNGNAVKNDKLVGTVLSQESGFISFKDLLKDNKIINSSVIVKKSKFVKCGEYESDFQSRGVEDYCMWLRFTQFGKIFFHNENLLNYRILEDSLSRQFKEDPRVFALVNFYRWLREVDLLSAKAQIKILRLIKKEI